MALPGAYAPANNAPRVIGGRKSPLLDKVVVLEEDLIYFGMKTPKYPIFRGK
jgi:hypothetical protein